MSNSREVIGGILPVGVDERPIYSLTTTPWGSSPSSVSLAAYSFVESTEAYTDITTTAFPSGIASVTGDVITFPVFVPPVAGTKVRIEVKFTTGGSILEAYRWLLVER